MRDVMPPTQDEIDRVHEYERIHKITEPRYTLEEAEKILDRRRCRENGHLWQTIELDQEELPVKIICSVCNTTLKVVKEESDE